MLPWSATCRRRVPWRILQSSWEGRCATDDGNEALRIWEGGCSPQTFQTRVLPVCKRMLALLSNVFSKRLKISRVRPGDDKMNTSSRYAKRNSLGSSNCCTSSNALCKPRLNNIGTRGSSCSPPSCCSMLCRTTSASSHTYELGCAYTTLANGCKLRRDGTSSSFDNIALRNTWSLCPYAVDGQHCQLGVCFGCRSDGVSNAIGSSSSGQRKLKRSACFFHVLAELTRQRLGREPAKRCSSGDASDSPIFLLESCHCGQHQRGRLRISGIFLSGQVLHCTEQQLGGLDVVETNSEYLVRATSRTWRNS